MLHGFDLNDDYIVTNEITISDTNLILWLFNIPKIKLKIIETLLFRGVTFILTNFNF